MHAAKLEKSERLQRVHAILSDGKWHTSLEITMGAFVPSLSAIISELRDNGCEITCRQSKTSGTRIFEYQMEIAE